MKRDPYVPRLSEYQKCLNCNAELERDAKFCVKCGQNTTPSERPFLSFVRQSFHEILDIDGRLVLTLRALLFKPGLASYEISQGKRVKYTPALRLYLVSSLLFFLVFESFQNIYTADIAGQQSTVEIYSRAMFVLFPMFAFFIKCFFWNSYYLSNLVFSMHIHSVAYVVLMIIGPLEAVESKNEALKFVQAIPAIYLVWYFLAAFKTMYREAWWITILKTMGVYLVYMATLGIVFDIILGTPD